MSAPPVKSNLETIKQYLGIQKATRVDIENAAQSELQAEELWGLAATGKHKQTKFEAIYNRCFERFSAHFTSSEPESLKREAVRQCILAANTRQRRKAGDGNRKSVKRESAETRVQQSSDTKPDTSAIHEPISLHQPKHEPLVHDPAAWRPPSLLQAQYQAQHDRYVFGLTSISVVRLEVRKWGELYMPLSLVTEELRTTLTEVSVRPEHTSIDMLIKMCKDDGLIKAQDELCRERPRQESRSPIRGLIGSTRHDEFNGLGCP